MNREPFSLQDAWEHVGAMFDAIVSLFGAPFVIAERLILLRKSRRDILAWLGPVEALARRVLLLRALAMPPSNYAPPKAATGRLLIAFTDKPLECIDPGAEHWRVQFCVMPHGVPRKKRGPESGVGQGPDKRSDGHGFNALPLARRLEALRRVLENPKPAIARLCRLLAAQRAAVVYAFRPYRPRATCVKTALADAQRELDLALNTS
ncbi:MAG: hypothetical protein WDN76_02860 [Alphaproteobacteria bacterium]